MASRAYGSAEWREAKPSNYALVIVKLLNSSDVYGAFNQVFGEYGLKIEVTGAEKIATSRKAAVRHRQQRVGSSRPKAVVRRSEILSALQSFAGQAISRYAANNYQH